MSIRKLYIVGSITDESFFEFSKQLTALEKDGNRPIQIEMHSEGGESYAGLAYANRIKASPCQISITVMGACFSAAVLPMAQCTIRRAHASAWFMVHEDSVELSGYTKDIAVKSMQGVREEQQYCALLESRTKESAYFWHEACKRTKYMNAAEAKELGLIDEVIE